jgi:adenylosuccinate synthase
VALKYAIQVNGVTQLMMMKGDVFRIETLKFVQITTTKEKK